MEPFRMLPVIWENLFQSLLQNPANSSNVRFGILLTVSKCMRDIIKGTSYNGTNSPRGMKHLRLFTLHLHKYSLQHYRGLPFIFRDYRTKTNINQRKSLYCFSKYSPIRSINFCKRLNQL